MSEKVSIAVVGAGYWGPNIIRNLIECPDADMRIVCDRQQGQLDKITSRYPFLEATTDLDEVLADPTIDAIAIATPVSTHSPIATAALNAGKHVFVEKPLAGSADDAIALLELAEANDLILMPGHTFLYSPSVNSVRDMIQNGDLGEVYFISTSRVNLGLHQPDVSVAWDLAPHDFSILRYWLEDTPIFASAMSRSCIMPNTPDVAFINLEFASQTIANVELSWLAPSKLRRTTIVGSRKMVVYDDTSTEPVRVFDSGVDLPDPGSFGEYKLSYRTGDIVSPRIGAAEPLGLELADFCNSVRTGEEPRSSAQLGVDVVRMVEAVDRSLALHGARVSIDTRVPILA
jgi:predicted dehydrogenase